MIKRGLTISVALALTMLAGCDKDKAAEKKDASQVIARVDDAEVTDAPAESRPQPFARHQAGAGGNGAAENRQRAWLSSRWWSTPRLPTSWTATRRC